MKVSGWTFTRASRHENRAEHHHNQPSGIIGAARLHLPLLEDGKLLSQKTL
jgi:hypothetical protein